MPSLLESLGRVPGVEVEIATVYPGLKDDEFTEDGVKYFALGQPKKPGIFFATRAKDIAACAALVRERTPDLVHIHGTERFYGLLPARKLIQAPCIISIQGLLSACRDVFFGRLSPREIWRANRLIELASRRGLLWLYREHQHAAQYEGEILANAPAFMGRTDWDRARIESVNPGAAYYHVGEVLREAFADRRWDLNACERHTILFTKLGRAPYRGTEVLLKALPLIRKQFPDVKLRMTDHLGTRRGYDRFLRKAIAESGVSENVELLGYLAADQMAAVLPRTHVFALASYVENSPNSLCEAMQVGLPCVAAYAGGVPSLIEHRRTGLLTPPGDAHALAAAIMTLFRDDSLAARLGRAASTEAAKRHDSRLILSQVLHAYNGLLAGQERELAACSI